MSSIKKEIFIASRFEEFREIRARLGEKINLYGFLEAIDLNNNEATHRSPLDESLFYAKKAEIMILLVGETYGTVPEGEEKSYTHLEYEEAAKESSNTRVLVFCIGPSYAGKTIRYSDDPRMRAWQIELEKNHRLSKFGDEQNRDEIVEKIMITVLTSLHDLNPGENLALVEDREIYFDAIGEEEENFLEDEESTFLDTQLSEEGGVELVDAEEEELEGFDLLKIPNRLAALEQKREAKKAIDLNDYYTAMQHLRKALELRPLDYESNYWLAKLYVASAKKSLFKEIEDYLLRAARIAQQEGKTYQASHCYQLIVQAAIFSDKKKEGEKYIALAEELTPNFARLYYEKAKFMLYFGQNEAAKDSIIQAMNIRLDLLKEMAHDPFFVEYKTIVSETKKALKDSVHKSCWGISFGTNTVREILGYQKKPVDLNGLSIYALWKKAKNNFILQYKLVVDNIDANRTDEIPQLLSRIEQLKSDLSVEEARLEEEASEKRAEALSEADRRRSERGEETGRQIRKLEKAFEDQRASMRETAKAKEKNIRILSVLFFALAVAATVGTRDWLPVAPEAKWSLAALFFALGGFGLYWSFRISQTLKQQLAEVGRKFEAEKEQVNRALEAANAADIAELETLFVAMKEKKEGKLAVLRGSVEAEIAVNTAKAEEVSNRYLQVSSALNYFETNTVGRSSSKFVPFRSLRGAKRGYIIRITPEAYRRYEESGKKVQVLNDFPEHLSISPIDPKEAKCLVKVVEKWHDGIVLSRFEAYSDPSVFGNFAKETERRV